MALTFTERRWLARFNRACTNLAAPMVAVLVCMAMMVWAAPSDRAGAPSASSPAVSPVPASIPDTKGN